MIRFPCHCGHRFELDEAEAGGLVQCPRCRRLNDVPNLSDAPGVADDGTIRLAGDEEAPARRPLDMADAERYFSNDLRRQRGQELDLRHDIDSFLEIGNTPADAPPERRPRQRYDPETGELIRPLDLAPMKAIPIEDEKPREPASTLGYAKRSTPEHNPIPSIRGLPVRMFRPANLFVWLVVTGVLLVAGTILGFPLGIFLAFFIFLPMMMASIGHVAAVIESTGPLEHDELPTPLRDVSFMNDIWIPFFRVAQAWLLTFGVVTAATLYFELPALLTLVLTLVALVVFPAVLLTLVAGAVYANLSPGRLWNVMRADLPAYAFATVVLGLGWPLAAFGFTAVAGVTAAELTRGMFILSTDIALDVPGVGVVRGFLLWLSGVVTLALGVYLMHLFGWIMGVHYRRRHESFDWLMQRHFSTRRDTMRQLEERRRQQNTPAGPPETPRSAPRPG